MTEAFEIVERFEKVVNTIDYQNNKHIQNIYKIYPRIVEVLPRIVHLLGKQGLVFREHRENLDEEECNMGKFLVFVKEMAIQIQF